jgi:hypothetical protein
MSPYSVPFARSASWGVAIIIALAAMNRASSNPQQQAVTPESPEITCSKVLNALAAGDEQPLLRYIAVDDPTKFGKYFQKVLTRARQLGLDWKQISLESSKSRLGELRMTISGPSGRYDIVLPAFFRYRGNWRSQSSQILGPAPHVALLRMKNAQNLLTQHNIFSRCYYKDLKWMVDFTPDGLRLHDRSKGACSSLTRDGGQKPVMSPDGKWIIYLAATSGIQTYHLVDLDGNRLDLGIPGYRNMSEEYAKWSQDSHLVLLNFQKASAILDVKTWTLTVVMEPQLLASTSDWLPGHRRIYVPGGRILDFDAKKAMSLCGAGTRIDDSGAGSEGISASPNGDWLIGFKTYANKTHAIVAVSTDGKQILQLDLIPHIPGPGGGYSEVYGLGAQWAAFSPNADYFVYYRRAAPPGMYVASLDGKEHFRVQAEGATCQWGPRGNLLFLGDRCYSLKDASIGFKTWARPPTLCELVAPQGWIFSPNADQAVELRPEGLSIKYKEEGLSVRECGMFPPEERLNVDVRRYRVLSSEARRIPVRVQVVKVIPRRLPSHKSSVDGALD